jgi:hypothetical protein
LGSFFKYIGISVANAFISPFNTQTMHIKSIHTYTTALLCFSKNLIPWRDLNPDLLIPEAGVMSIAPLRQGNPLFVKMYAKLLP